MWLGIISLFPEMFEAITAYGVTGRAVENELLKLEIWNPRDFATDKHRTVDDKPYGGGPGMLMKVGPLRDAIATARSIGGADCKVIYLSPQGKRLEQEDLKRLARSERLVLVAGRYEGIDERIIEVDVDEEFSIGDYVLSGGELPAMVLIDGLARLLPGVVGDPESVERESFCDGVLEYPQYTRPESIDGADVPPVLLSGNHEEISRWRLKQSLGKTFERRPDLLKNRQMTKVEQDLLAEYLSDHAREQEINEDTDNE